MNFDMNMLPEDGGMIPWLGDDDLIPLYEYLQHLSVGIDEMRASILALQSGQIVYQHQQSAERINGLIMTLGNLLREYGVIQNQLIGTLKAWQRKQALAMNGAPSPSNLDGIQKIVETLLDCIKEITLFINNLLQMKNEAILNEYLQHAQVLYHILIVSTFIVETQPPQVRKKKTKNMSATVRWLIGDKLGIHLSKPVVKCEILSETLAKRLTVENLRIPPESSGTITDNECVMVYDGNTRKFSAQFSNLMINEIDRFERKGSENVTDRKHTLLFYTTAICKGHAINCWAISVPLVVVVHDNQAMNAWATIIWDNAFSVIDREPFKVPERVHYTQILEALDMYFHKETGRQLTRDNLKIIANKLRVNEAGQINDFISFSQFCKDKMPNCTFTFWEWFFDIKKLTKNHLQEAWTNGHIVGFIGKREASEILTDQANGTFLLRFSDSTKGAISIAYRDYYGNIIMLEPSTSANLDTRSLADRIRDLDFLRIVYPTMMPSNAAFSNPAPIQKAKSKDYVGHELKVQVDSGGSQSQSPNDPQTSPQTQSGTTVSDNVYMQNGRSLSTEQFEDDLEFLNTSPQTQSGTTVSDSVYMQNGSSLSIEQFEDDFEFLNTSPQTQSGTTVSDSVYMQNGSSLSIEQFEDDLEFLNTDNSLNWFDWNNSRSSALGYYFSGSSMIGV